MKKRGHERKLRRQYQRAVRNSSPASPAKRPASLAQRTVARLNKWRVRDTAYSNLLREVLSSSLDEMMAELHHNPWDRPGTTPSSQPQPATPETSSSQPEPKSETASPASAPTLPASSASVAYSRPDLVSLTVKDLQAMAKNNGITGYSRMRKTQLVDVLAEVH